MEAGHRAVLLRLRGEISEQLVVLDSVVPHLLQEEVLTEQQVEEIRGRSSERSRALLLLDLLPIRGPRAFREFLRALDDFSWVRDRILQDLRDAGPGPGPGPGPGTGPGLQIEPGPGTGPGDEQRPEPPPTPGPGSGSTGNTGPRGSRVPTDRQLCAVASVILPVWDQVLLDLGLSVSQVSSCRSDHVLSLRSAALQGLVTWRRAGGRRGATLDRLQQSLERLDIHPSVLDQVLDQVQD